jgi:CarD family transcriptional regulator
MTISTSKAAFAPGDVVVYPGHGVGTVTELVTQHIADQPIELFVINFAHDRMTLRVPLKKAKTSGLRGISSPRVMQSALSKLKEPAHQKKGMWSRRALEYTSKINSGDPVALAEVVRDLHRPAGERERSHSERLLFEQALGRLTHELAAVESTEIDTATLKLEKLLNAA